MLTEKESSQTEEGKKLAKCLAETRPQEERLSGFKKYVKEENYCL